MRARDPYSYPYPKRPGSKDRDIDRPWQARRPWRHLSRSERLAHQHYWRAKRIAGGTPNGYWPGAWWDRLIFVTGSRCWYCDEYTDQPSPDHAQPLSRGGSNEWRNIRLACPHCQRQKGAKTEEEFTAWWAEQKRIAKAKQPRANAKQPKRHHGKHHRAEKQQRSRALQRAYGEAYQEGSAAA